MNKTTIEHRFKIGDKVRHISTGSPDGYVVDFIHYGYHKYTEYHVTFGTNNTGKFYENELIKSKDNKYGKDTERQ